MFPLRRGDPVRVRLGMDEGGRYLGRNGPVMGFFSAKIIAHYEMTSVVRFEKKIAPDYPNDPWASLGEEYSESDEGYVDEICNSQIQYVGL